MVFILSFVKSHLINLAQVSKLRFMNFQRYIITMLCFCYHIQSAQLILYYQLLKFILLPHQFSFQYKIANLQLFVNINKTIFYNFTLLKTMPSNSTVVGNNKYVLQKVIASGSFGKVYDCFPFAVKEIKLPTLKDAHPNLMLHIKNTLENEINILRDVNHPNVVKLFQVIYQQDSVYLVMEHCQSDLKMQCINKPQGEKKAVQIMQQILKGCREMVKLNVVHRDFKPANILCNKGTYKLADFGMAKYLQGSQDNMLKSHVGTPYYMAPQILQRKSYTKKCDIWSLGVIFYQLVFGRLPWQGKDEKALLTNILSQKLRFPSSISPEIKDVLSRMLSISEHKRLGWEEVFTVFELLRNKTEKQEHSLQRITIHRSVIEQMINIEKERIAMMEFKHKYECLDSEQALYVRKILESLLGQQHLYIIREFILDRRKLQE